MKFCFVATILFGLTTGANALWCCCALDKNSQACCQSVMGTDTFFSAKCGLINGQSCDVGGSPSLQDDYKYCCNYREGSGSGTCF